MPTRTSRHSPQDPLDSYLPFIESYLDDEDYAGFPERAFRHWAFQEVYAFKGHTDPDTKRYTTIDAHGDIEIDGYWVDSEESGITLHLFQSKWSRKPQQYDTQDLDHFIRVPHNLLNQKLVHASHNPHLITLAEEYRSLIKSGVLEVRLALATTKNISGQAQHIANQASNAEQIKLTVDGSRYSITVVLDAFDRAGLAEHEEKLTSYGRKKPRVNIEFINDRYFNDHYTEADEDAVETVKNGVTGLVKVKDLITIFDKENINIFQRNPRGHVGAPIHRGIVKTLMNERQKHRLHLLNNGIRVTCDSLTPSQGEPSKYIVHNFQVVNGYQTLTTLARNRELVDDDVLLEVRIVEATSAFGENIAIASNSQTGLKPRDRRAFDRPLRRLQRAFKTARWFLEIGSGEFQKLNLRRYKTAADTDPRTPYKVESGRGYRVISIPNLVQARLCFAGYPGVAFDRTRFVINPDQEPPFDIPSLEDLFPRQLSISRLLLEYKIFRIFTSRELKQPRQVGTTKTLEDTEAQPSIKLPTYSSTYATWIAGLILEHAGNPMNDQASTQLLDSMDKWSEDLITIAANVIENGLTMERATFEKDQPDEIFDARAIFRTDDKKGHFQTGLPRTLQNFRTGWRRDPLQALRFDTNAQVA